MELTEAHTAAGVVPTIPKGFKLTEVGLIPYDWEVRTVLELIDLLTDYDANGSFASVADNVRVFDSENFAWYVRSTDLENNTPMTAVRYVDIESYRFLKKTSLHGGELLFLKRGDIGRVYLFKMRSDFATVAPNLYLLKINELTFPEYLYYFFKTTLGQSQLKSKNASSTLGALYKDDVKAIKVPLPPTLGEQQAIAEALSDMDAMIRQLEQLIEKKKAIKQGAMQELLKPKEGWVETSLLDICNGEKNRFDDGDWIESEFIIDKGIRLIQTNNVGVGSFIQNPDNKKFISSSSFDKLKCKDVYEGDLLICRLADPAGRACIVPPMEESRMITSVDVTIVRPDSSKANKSFIKHMSCTWEWFAAIAERTGGTTHKRVSRSSLGKIPILLPLVEEQERIAQVLDSMDDEIEGLNDKLTKARQLKQGMMQELLTGRKRLV